MRLLELYKQVSLEIFARYYNVTNSINDKYINKEFCNKVDSFIFQANTMIIFAGLTGKVLDYYKNENLNEVFWDDYKYFMKRDFISNIFRRDKVLEEILNKTYLVSRYFSSIENNEN